MRGFTTIALVLGLVVPTTSCASCSEAGCESALRLTWSNLGASEGTEVCLGSRCVVASGFASSALVNLDGITLKDEIAKLDVRRLGRGEGVSTLEVPVQVTYPNGEKCPPVCKNINVTVGPDGKVRPSRPE